MGSEQKGRQKKEQAQEAEKNEIINIISQLAKFKLAQT
jgi:hypothetical protein